MSATKDVAGSAELGEGGMLRVEHLGRAVLLARVNGRAYAVDDLCTHEDASLFTGCLKGTAVKCPLHGARFDLATGLPLEEPADEAIATYELEERNGRIYLGNRQE
ncbi:MAG: non-heme iron oxygenase ferredoxin subunit [Chromatiales bacterium]|nr:non-heme iron oxygenase ferredoxin subunit [Chromatiales bacterium]